MSDLRRDQLDRLARHQQRAFDRWALALSSYSGELHLREYAQGQALLDARREELGSVAITAAASTIEMRRAQQERVDDSGLIAIGWTDAFPVRVLQGLGRRRLPMAAEDVELVLDLGTSTMSPENVFLRSFEVVLFGVSAATQVLREHPGSPPVLAALERAVRAIDDLGLVHTTAPGKLAQRMRALLSANVPGGLLDLSVVSLSDAWGERAADVLRRRAESWVLTPDLLALLARSRGTRPTQAWRRDAARLGRDREPFAAVLEELLEAILEIELSTSRAPWPPVWLLAPENEVLARGAAWATTEVEASWVVPLLGRLALRCAAPSPHPSVTTALCHAVASGAIEALVLRDSDESRAELRTLLGEIRRRDLLKRIAAVVGEDRSGTAARDERIRRGKRRAVQRKANPEPKERQRQASAYVRRDLAPILREAGFDDEAGRTFWRTGDDRVEWIHCKAHTGGLTLELGIWFPFVPRWYALPERAGRARPTEFACDLRGNVHAWHDDLSAAFAKAELWFGRWRPLPVVLGWLLDGARSEEAFHWGAQGSATHSNLVGYLAKHLGQDGLAREHLSRVASHYASDPPSETSPEWESWLARVRDDAGL